MINTGYFLNLYPKSCVTEELCYLQRAINRRDWTMCRDILKSDRNLIYQVDQNKKTLFHSIIDVNDLEAFRTFIEIINLNRFEAIILDNPYSRTTIHEYIFLHGSEEMLETCIKPNKGYANHYYDKAVSMLRYDLLEWLAEKMPFEESDYSAFRIACKQKDEKYAFFFLTRFQHVQFITRSYGDREILAKVIDKNRSLALIDVIVKKIDLQQTFYQDLTYSSGYSKNVYSTLINTFNEEKMNYFINLKGADVLKGRYEFDRSVLIIFAKAKKLDYLFELINKIPNGWNLLEKELLELLFHSIKEKDLETVKKLYEYQLDINSISVYQGSLTPVISHALIYDAACVDFFIEKKVKVWNESRAEPLNFSLEAAIKNENIYYLRYFIETAESKNYSFAKDLKFAWNKSQELLTLLLTQYIKNEFSIEFQLAQTICETILKHHFELEKNLIPVLKIGAKICTTHQDWMKYLGEVAYFTDKLSQKFVQEQFKYLAEEVFTYIFDVMNPGLLKIPKVLVSITDAILSLPVDHIEFYLLGLQSYDHKLFNDFSMIKRTALFRSKVFPNYAKFLTLPLEEQLTWVELGALFRSRKSVSLNYSILKQNPPEISLLKILFKGMYRIGISYHTSSKNWLITRLKSLLETLKEDLKCEIVKVLWIIEKNANNIETRDFLIKQYNQTNDVIYKKCLIETLAKFNHHPDFKFAETLIRHLNNSDNADERRNIAKALSKIPYQKGLLPALSVIQSEDWAKYSHHYGYHKTIKLNNPFQLFTVPKGWHVNREAMVEGIIDQLVEINFDSPYFQQSLEKAMASYQLNPETFPRVKKIESLYKKEFRQSVGAPIFFPKHAKLIRVIGCVKGVELFRGAFIDLLTQGCGSSDLTQQGVSVNFASWSKKGDIFATHDPKLYFEESSNFYLTGANSVIIIFSADDFNQRQRLGEGRIEDEVTLNPVFYGGFPKSKIERLYVHSQYRHDIELLTESDALHQLESKWTSTLFKNKTVQELVQLRRSLLLKENVAGIMLSLVERIKYFDENFPLNQENLEKDFYFASRKEIYQESMRRVIAREIMGEYLSFSKKAFMSQNDLLRENDATFREFLPNFMKMMPASILKLKTLRSNTTLYENEFENVEQRLRALDLSSVDDENPEIKVIMRLAVLFKGLEKIFAKHNLAHHEVIILIKKELEENQKLLGFAPESIHLIVGLIQQHKYTYCSKKHHYLLQHYYNFNKIETLNFESYQTMAAKINLVLQ